MICPRCKRKMGKRVDGWRTCPHCKLPKFDPKQVKKVKSKKSTEKE